jgi:nicotine blue oxidoreductase
LSASLRAGLAELLRTNQVESAIVVPVDQPGLTAVVVRRFVAIAGADALARATYRGQPGPPVLLGRRHWPGAGHSAAGQTGARDYLAHNLTVELECSTLADGNDVDTVADLPVGHLVHREEN